MHDKNPCPEPKPHRQRAEFTTSFPISAARKARFFFGCIWTIIRYAFHMTYISMGFTSPAFMKRTLFFLLSYNKVCYWILRCVQHVADICGVLLLHLTHTTKWAISPSKINPAPLQNTSYFRNTGAKQHTSANTEHIKSFKEVLFPSILLRRVMEQHICMNQFSLGLFQEFSVSWDLVILLFCFRLLFSTKIQNYSLKCRSLLVAGSFMVPAHSTPHQGTLCPSSEMW